MPCVKLLLSRGADKRIKGGVRAAPPLFFALARARWPAPDTQPARAPRVRTQGQNAAEYASDGGHYDVAKLLE